MLWTSAKEMLEFAQPGAVQPTMYKEQHLFISIE